MESSTHSVIVEFDVTARTSEEAAEVVTGKMEQIKHQEAGELSICDYRVIRGHDGVEGLRQSFDKWDAARAAMTRRQQFGPKEGPTAQDWLVADAEGAQFAYAFAEILGWIEDPEDRRCEECDAEPGEPCRPYCTARSSAGLPD